MLFHEEVQKMRRKDRDVENRDEIYDILKRCDTIKIAMHGDVYPYLVPVSFGAEIVKNKIVIFFTARSRAQNWICSERIRTYA